MVAKENDKLVSVPPLLLSNKDEVRRFSDALYRKKLKAYYREQMSIIHDQEFDVRLALLKGERCEVALT